LNTTIQLRGWFDAKEEQILAVGNYRIFDYGEFHFHDGDSSEKTYIRFSDLLWQILTENCVPLSREIAAQLGRSPRALDIYQWLAYRTYALKKPVVVSWENLRSQFDSADTPMYSFRRRFCRSLEKVSDAWPELVISVGEKGLTVYPTGSSLTSGRRKQNTPKQRVVSSARKSVTTENPF
ncbi:replication protein RepA, partial [Bifidobacterium adolescentis]